MFKGVCSTCNTTVCRFLAKEKKESKKMDKKYSPTEAELKVINEKFAKRGL